MSNEVAEVSVPLKVEKLKGVGKAVTEKLARIHIHTVQDLLFHLPIRYEDRTKITPLHLARPMLPALFEAEVVDAAIQFGKRRSLRVRIKDNTGVMSLRFYYFGAPLRAQMVPGTRIRVWGEPRRGASGLEIYHPELTVLKTDSEPPALADRLTPIYGTTEGLTQKTFQKISEQALEWLGEQNVEDLLPHGGLLAGLPTLEEALRLIHRPPVGVSLEMLREGTHPAVQRLAIEEMTAHHLSLLRLRDEYRAERSVPLNASGGLVDAFVSGLPFVPTNAQRRVVAEVTADLSQDVAMMRLVQGDVGSGKTVVGACAALQAVQCGFQAAFMAPTEILAEQHFINLKQWFEPLGVKVAWLASKMTAAQRRESLAQIASGEAQVVVGTHALFQPEVDYLNLALIIIDEQHRFGVDQRLALRSKGVAGAPHQLVMTATPIPRTLAMTAYADLDCSIIDELPPGRTPINTVVIGNSRRDEIVERIRNTCLSGRQAYWVCTLIDESEAVEAEAAELVAETLQGQLNDVNVGLVHGRMKPAEKEATMAAFKANEIQLLVATTVIEVGVDVPNATVMVIENPERLGLAQLHQLRGRVGRGDLASYCVLLYQPPLSTTAKSRLQVMRESTDGFVIAEKDLELRGAGELLGKRQTGEVGFRIAQIERDQSLLPSVRSLSEQLLKEHPNRAPILIDRWLAGTEHFVNA